MQYWNENGAADGDDDDLELKKCCIAHQFHAEWKLRSRFDDNIAQNRNAQRYVYHIQLIRLHPTMPIVCVRIVIRLRIWTLANRSKRAKIAPRDSIGWHKHCWKYNVSLWCAHTHMWKALFEFTKTWLGIHSIRSEIDAIKMKWVKQRKNQSFQIKTVSYATTTNKRTHQHRRSFFRTIFTVQFEFGRPSSWKFRLWFMNDPKSSNEWKWNALNAPNISSTYSLYASFSSHSFSRTHFQHVRI